MSDVKTIWGIDLGTTYSCIAHVDATGHVVVVDNLDGDAVTPSVVFFADPDNAVVGKSAKGEAAMTPELVASLVKQHMGDQSWSFRAHDVDWSAHEVSAQILRTLASSAQAMTGIPVEDVVITVPAYFGVSERDATIAAGTAAGLNVRDVINEPTAAAFAYGFVQGSESEETVLVYDLGGGTFDVTVIRLSNDENGSARIDVAATGGDDHLGGAQWDQALVQLIADKFMADNPAATDPLDDPSVAADLRLKAEDTKRSLTVRDSATVMVSTGTERASVTITRAEFEEVTRALLERTVEFTRSTLEAAEAKGVTQIDRVLLVGGSSFMPAVARRLTEAFPGWTPELRDPNQAVAKGAALVGAKILVGDLVKEAMGTIDGPPSAAQDTQAIDIAAQRTGLASAVVKRLAQTEFTNVCSRAFGVKVQHNDPPVPNDFENPANHYIDHIIEAQTTLPVTGLEEGRVQTYGTVSNGQSSVRIELWEQNSQEQSPELASNKLLEAREFQLTRAYPVGAPITIALGMDASGVLQIQATDPDGLRMEFSATSTDGVLTDEQVAASTARVQALQQL